MSASRQAAPNTPLSPIVAVTALIAAGVATYYQWPGVAVLWAGILFASLFSIPPVLTGPKDMYGQPGIGPPAEARQLSVHRRWSELRYKLFTPSADWFPNTVSDIRRYRPSTNAGALQLYPRTIREYVTAHPWAVTALDLAGVVMWLVVPARFTYVAAAGAALVAFTLPTVAVGSSWAWANAAAAFILVIQWDASTRRHANAELPNDGVRLSAVATLGAPAVVGLVGAGVALAFTLGTALALSPVASLINPAWKTMLGLALVFASLFLHARLRSSALLPWHQTVAARETWTRRWASLKMKEEPTLISHERVGAPEHETTVDIFETRGETGAAGAIACYAKLLPMMGTGTRFAMLATPDIGADGQPIEGSKHPTRFRVVTWQQETVPTVAAATDAGVDQVELGLFVESAVFWAAQAATMPQPVLVGLELISRTTTAEDARSGAESPTEAPTAAWASYFRCAEYSASAVLGAGSSSLSASLQTEMYVDDVQGTAVLYFGEVTAPTTELIDPTLLARLEELEVGARWDKRWHDLLKVGERRPVLQYAARDEAQLGEGGPVLHAQPFMVNQGLDPAAFYTPEKQAFLATTLKAAPFVTVTGYQVAGYRDGERHQQGFSVVWSHEPVPTNPADIRPSPQRKAHRWVLAGAINNAFDAAKLARPEVIATTPLTSAETLGSIWAISLRLYNGVTSAAVKAAAEKIRLSFGCSWIRITESTDGCTIYAGADPKSPTVHFVDAASEEKCLELNWEKAFIDAKVISPADGAAPKLLKTGVLPKNPQVQVLEFRMPSGLSLESVKAAQAKLMGSTGNLFVEVRSGATGDTFQLLASTKNPMPFPAPIDWSEMMTSKGIPFAAGVEGEPVTYDWREDAHLLVAGSSGSGKSATLQILLTGALLKGCEVYLADPSKGAADFRYAAPWMKAIASEIDEASAMMSAVYAEVTRRKNLNKEYGTGSYTDLPADVRPPHIVVFIDEFTSLMATSALPKATGDETDEVLRARADTQRENTARQNIGMLTGKVAREARSAGVTLILATQKLSAKSLDEVPNAGDLKTNLGRMLLGAATFGEKQSALRNPVEAPLLGDRIPRGRGLFESGGGTAKMIQSWYDVEGHLASMTAKLDEHLHRLADEEKLDFTPFLVPADEDDANTYRRPSLVELEPLIVDLGAMEFTLEDLDEYSNDPVAGMNETAADAEAADMEAPDDDDDDVEAPVAAEAADTANYMADRADAAAPTRYSGTIVLCDGFDGVGLAALGPVLAFSDRPAVGPSLTRLDGDDADGGWWKLGALRRLLYENPEVSHVVWADAALANDDAIGIPYADVAQDLGRQMGLELVAVSSAEDVSAALRSAGQTVAVSVGVAVMVDAAVLAPNLFTGESVAAAADLFAEPISVPVLLGRPLVSFD